MSKNFDEDLGFEIRKKKETYNNGNYYGKQMTLPRYIRVTGKIVLICSIIAAVFLLFKFSFIEVSIYDKEFSPLGICLAFVAVLNGTCFHAFFLGFAHIVENVKEKE